MPISGKIAMCGASPRMISHQRSAGSGPCTKRSNERQMRDVSTSVRALV